MQGVKALSLICILGFMNANHGMSTPNKSDSNNYDSDRISILKQKLASIKRLNLAVLPTPIYELKNLSKQLGGVRVYLKSDNLTGHGGGGNKLRKLEFVLAEALAKGATDIITTGATQSNHSRMTASQCAKLGLTCHLILENRRSNYEQEHMNSGNVFLDKLFNANIHHVPEGTDTRLEMKNLYNKLLKEGKKPYIVEGGASTPLGALGYVNAAVEIMEQLDMMDLKLDYIVTATGSAGTQSGLNLGLQAINSSVKLLGISTRADQASQINKVSKLMFETADFLKINRNQIDQSSVLVNSNYIGKGYGEPTDLCINAIKTLASYEGILLDPVYSGKAMAGLIDLVKKKEIPEQSSILFLHTGGEDSLNAYKKYF